MKKIVMLTLIMFLSFSVSSFANIIVLKSNNAIEGKIIEKTDKYVKIYSAGVSLTYYLDEIESIDGNPIQVISFDEMAKIAEKEAQVAIQDNPNSAEANNQKGVVSRMQGDQQQAIKSFSKAIEIDPQYAEAYLNRGLSYSSGEIQEYNLAIDDFNKSIELNPSDNFFAYLSRGLVYAQKGEHDLAISDFSKAIEARPSDADAYYRRGASYGNKGNYDQALLDFSKAIEIDPQHGSAYNDRAIVYYYKKEYDKAWNDVHKIEELGGQAHPQFLKGLKEESGREK